MTPKQQEFNSTRLNQSLRGKISSLTIQQHVINNMIFHHLLSSRYPVKSGAIRSPVQQIKAPIVQAQLRAPLQAQEPEPIIQQQVQQQAALTQEPVRSPSTNSRYLGIGRRNPDENVWATYPETD